MQDPDVFRSASHQLMAAHLTGPLSAGAVDWAPTIAASGRVASSEPRREPLVLVAPASPLGARPLRVRAVLDPDGAATLVLPELVFSSFTEAGAFLPLHRPPADPATGLAAPFTLALQAAELDDAGNAIPIAAAALGARLEVRIFEGILGRLIYVMGAEKQRIRRQAREIAAMRLVATAHGDALDRIGAELSVPRLTDLLQFDPATREIVTVNGKPESDNDYRRRLKMYRSFSIPNRSRLLDLLNGSGIPGDPNRGPLGEMGFLPRFEVMETDNEFGLAIHLISAGPDQARVNFLNHLRATRLILPAAVVQANTLHQGRFLPSGVKSGVAELRQRLRQNFLFDNTAAIAPGLASVLDRVGRCRRALGVNTQWRVLRAQDSAGGSRYELGLGADLELLAPAELDLLRSALLDPLRPVAPEPEIEVLLRSMAPLPPGQDPEGAWLLRPCGLRTVHRAAANRVYVSHLPAFGMRIAGVGNTAPGAKVDLEVQYNAPGDPQGNVVLLAALNEVASRWTAGGNPAFTRLAGAAGAPRWDLAVPVVQPAMDVLQKSGLRAVTAPAPVVAQLKNLPPELLETLVLAPAQSAAILNNVGNPTAALQALVALLRDQGVSSVLPLVTSANDVVLVAGVIGLPEVGTNLSQRRATGFRWYAVPLRGEVGDFKAVGSRGFLVPKTNGLFAMVALGYARRGLTDPYEYRVELPAAARLNLLQYEFLMNLLDHVYPLGIEINTFSLRRDHVDLDGDGAAEPLPPVISRTFRRFLRRRHTGESAVAAG